MKNYPVPPDYCLIVNAFSQATTLRGAAQLLGVDPASLVRKAQRISEDFGFLKKVGNRWTVSEKGLKVAQWASEANVELSKLLDEKPQMRLAAFTWLAEEMLIPNYESLNLQFGSKYSWAFNMTASDLEQELLLSRCDFVVTGHAPNDPGIAYKKINTFDWVVVAPSTWRKKFDDSKDTISFLNSKPFVRHTKRSPGQILGFTPELITHVSVDSVVGLRAVVASGLGWTALPRMAVQSFLRIGKLVEIKTQTYITDEMSLWWLRSRRDTKDVSKKLISWISEFEVV